MDYSALRFEAVVDFVEIELHTAQKHLGGTIHKQLAIFGFSHFTPVRANAGGWDSCFRIRLYDVGTFAKLKSKIATIESELDLVGPPIITRIEVAFDGYLKSEMQDHAGAAALLAALAARMAYRIAHPVSKNTRIFHEHKGSPTALPRHQEALERKMEAGWNVGIGNKTDNEYQHGYLKIVDHNKTPLDQRQHRARFEIRLADSALLTGEVEQWAHFKFESLAPFLCFRKEDDRAPTIRKAVVAGLADRASHRKEIKRRDGGGVRRNIMPADSELNRVVRDKLRELTRRWTPSKRAPPQHESAKIEGEKYTFDN